MKNIPTRDNSAPISHASLLDSLPLQGHDNPRKVTPLHGFDSLKQNGRYAANERGFFISVIPLYLFQWETREGSRKACWFRFASLSTRLCFPPLCLTAQGGSKNQNEEVIA